MADSISSAEDIKVKMPVDSNNRASWMRIGVSERKALLYVLDLLLLNTALIVTLIVRDYQPIQTAFFFEKLPYFGVLFVLWTLCSLLFGNYNLITSASPWRSAWTTSITVLVTSFSYLLIPFWTPPLSNSRFETILFPLLSIVLLVLWRVFYACVFAQPRFSQKVIIIGAGGAGQELVKALYLQGDTFMSSRINHNIGYEVIGFIDDAIDKVDSRINDIPVLGNVSQIVSVVQEIKPDQVVLCITNPQNLKPHMLESVLTVRKLGIEVSTMASLYGHVTGRVPVEHIGLNIDAVLEVDRFAWRKVYFSLRRLIDLIFGIQGCAILALLIPIVWFANKRYSPGPLFYRQNRVGYGGEAFEIIKFRSMVVDAEKFSGAVWAEEDDPRITKIGRFLRLTRLDEIPQFWNIMCGDMSLIGPRPERPHFVEMLAEEIPFYETRHAVKPGLTGWAQVMYRYGASAEDSLIKLQYDLFYIKHQGVFLDLKIVLKTVGVVLGFKGR